MKTYLIVDIKHAVLIYIIPISESACVEDVQQEEQFETGILFLSANKRNVMLTFTDETLMLK